MGMAVEAIETQIREKTKELRYQSTPQGGRIANKEENNSTFNDINALRKQSMQLTQKEAEQARKKETDEGEFIEARKKTQAAISNQTNNAVGSRNQDTEAKEKLAKKQDRERQERTSPAEKLNDAAAAVAANDSEAFYDALNNLSGLTNDEKFIAFGEIKGYETTARLKKMVLVAASKTTPETAKKFWEISQIISRGKNQTKGPAELLMEFAVDTIDGADDFKDSAKNLINTDKAIKQLSRTFFHFNSKVQKNKARKAQKEESQAINVENIEADNNLFDLFGAK